MVVAELVVDARQALGQPVLTSPDVALPRVVGAVSQPDLEVARPRLRHHLDAVEVVLDRLVADLRVGVGEAAELVVVVLEGVAVDRAQRHALLLGVRPERTEVVDEVPGDVQGHRRREPGEAVHRGRVGDLLVDGPRSAGAAEHLEPGAELP